MGDKAGMDLLKRKAFSGEEEMGSIHNMSHTAEIMVRVSSAPHPYPALNSNGEDRHLARSCHEGGADNYSVVSEGARQVRIRCHRRPVSGSRFARWKLVSLFFASVDRRDGLSGGPYELLHGARHREEASWTRVRRRCERR